MARLILENLQENVDDLFVSIYCKTLSQLEVNTDLTQEQMDELLELTTEIMEVQAVLSNAIVFDTHFPGPSRTEGREAGEPLLEATQCLQGASMERRRLGCGIKCKPLLIPTLSHIDILRF